MMSLENHFRTLLSRLKSSVLAKRGLSHVSFFPFVSVLLLGEGCVRG